MSDAPRVGIIDSGVHVAHPHVGGIRGGITVTADGYAEEYTDCLGHGTAIAALIHSLAPRAELYAVRVFDRTLATSIDRVMRAIDWCLESEIQIINLSLGTANPKHRNRFETVLDRVRSAGAVLVSAFEMSGQLMLPGALLGVIGVSPDPECAREEYRVIERVVDGDRKKVFLAPPFPRDIPGVPREHNLNGVSFAVAHMSAHLARCRSGSAAGTGDWEYELVGAEERHISL